ncbi:PEGA domain-containing protein [Candidatus Uabimicrobium sp. HlEnr_7]|uniref:PEGA domain-containing protein n=1 Tax=Candidatus Uabimicrobium helgolandensis TaxID=3095367 RepID=UPI003556FCA8
MVKNYLCFIFLYICVFADGQLRKIELYFTSDYNSQKTIALDELLLNSNPVKNGEKIRAGEYRVVVKKRGYKPMFEYIAIPISSKPYVYRRTLTSSRRKVLTKIRASFPKMRIHPDLCTLDGEKVNGQSFKPGKYKLRIQRSGYVPINKTIEIAPSHEPYEITCTLYPKLIELQLKLSYDVPPEDDFHYIFRLKSEMSIMTLCLRSGYKIVPESYLYTIESLGYKIIADRMLVMPRERPYVVKHCLISLQRNVIINVTDEFDNFTTAKITLNDEFVHGNFKVKPGNYSLIIKKEGYLTIHKQIAIFASEKTLVLKQKLQLQ